MPSDPQHRTVPVLAKQGDQAPAVASRWGAERAVWTDRMLTALEQGVQGGVWFSLIDKVWLDRNLRASYAKVHANRGEAGVDHMTVEDFGEHLDENLKKIVASLQADTFRPQEIRRAYIPKAGSAELRPLGIPTVRDRVVQGAIRHVMEPIFEKEFAEQSYGFRPGKGCKDALRRLDELLKSGYVYVVDVDLKSYFDTIPHDRLMDRVRTRIADGRLLSLIESYLQAGIMEDMRTWTPLTGSPQGAVISPLLSNIYLDPLDHEMTRRGCEMLRYADDFVIVCRSQAEAEAALTYVCQWCAAEGLTIHPTKTRIVDVRTGAFEFLGYSFQTLQRGPRQGRIVRWPRKSSLAKLKENLRKKTRRTSGSSLQETILRINRTLRGWFEYFKHSYYTTFGPLDGWVRKRLRSILRKRAGRRGPGRGRDHQRWPNEYFANLGFFSLEAAHRRCQPPRG